MFVRLHCVHVYLHAAHADVYTYIAWMQQMNLHAIYVCVCVRVRACVCTIMCDLICKNPEQSRKVKYLI